LSRLRSTGSSGSTATRAAAPRRPGVLVQSPKSDIYVVLLGISLGAILLGCLLMTLLLARYGFSVKAAAAPGPVQMTRMA
jgi:hypothetical protein